MSWTLTVPEASYETARREFEWSIPDDYNLARDLVGKHDPERPALHEQLPDGTETTYTFGELDRDSDRVAAALHERGVERGDRVGVVLSQTVENPLVHLACWKLGAVSLPLSVLFGPDALASRLDDSGAVAVVASAERHDAITEAATACPALDLHVERGETATGAATPFADLLDGPATFDPVETTPETPATVIYTSGSTGPPKGVLHTHDSWVAHCPSFQLYFELDPTGVFWTPADWAWIGALGDLLFPAWHYGQPVVGAPTDGFDPVRAYELMAQYDVTNSFLPPTAIRMLMDEPADAYDLSLSAICSGGEPLTPEILDWARDDLGGVAVNELYGQTEANVFVANCTTWFETRPGSMGKPVPGHDVAPVDPETGERRPDGEVGELAIKREGDPIVFEEYWNRPETTTAATVDAPDGGTWHLTGDLGWRDEDGYFWFKSRADDVIITAGYRVGPGEVERAILDHSDVTQVGVVGVDDELRGEKIAAFVQPADAVTPGDELREEIRTLVRERLAKHEYPREIQFREELPQTTTGKIKRRELGE